MSNAKPLTLRPYRLPDRKRPGFRQGDPVFPDLFGFKWTLKFVLTQRALPSIELNLRDIICSRLAVEGMRLLPSLYIR